MTAYSPAKGDWAVITGAGRGIGRFLAQHFANKGMRVAALDIDANEAAATAALCGEGSLHFTCDVSNRDDVARVAEGFADKGIVPSLLWLNAGVGTANTILGAKPHTLDWLMGVNVHGPINCAQAFVPAMRKAGGARHVGVTASSASVTPVSGPFTLYATTKQMTAAVGEALAAELADDEIGVTILCPGILDTDIWNAAQARPERFGGARQTPDKVGDHWRAQPGAEVLAKGIDEALAAGGGWCIIPTEQDTEPKMQQRHEAQRSGLKSYAVQKGTEP